MCERHPVVVVPVVQIGRAACRGRGWGLGGGGCVKKEEAGKRVRVVTGVLRFALHIYAFRPMLRVDTRSSYVRKATRRCGASGSDRKSGVQGKRVGLGGGRMC